MTNKDTFAHQQPQPPDIPPDTPQPQIDAALAVLQAHKDAWVALDPALRVLILDEIQRDLMAVAGRWVAAGCKAKGLSANTLGEAEEWLFFAAIARAVRLLRQVLAEIQESGRPRLPGPVTQAANGQVVVRVFPHSRWDRLLFTGISGEVWQEPGVTEEAMVKTQARAYQDRSHAGKVALVLGAGNASMLPAIDVLHKIFVEDQVVALKLNPVNAYLGPLIEESFRALTRRGFLQLVYGGAATGAYLCQHPAIDELHLTGSAATFEAVTFGPGAEGQRRKAARTPLNVKRFTAELGNVSPVIVVPGAWNPAEVAAQAEEIATWLIANAGFGCLTPRVVIQHQAWPLRPDLIEAIGHALAQAPTRPAYYPGAGERHAAFVQAHPDARYYGRTGDGRLPWTLIPDVDPAHPADVCFQREAFCGLLAETALPAADVPAFIDNAVEFANTVLWGTLNATLIVHPASLRDPRVAAAVECAIANLRYGTVLINIGAYAGYYFQVTPWGAFPGHDLYDIQSGVGKSANLLMFDRPQKSVIRAPFSKRFNPVRVTSKRAHDFARKLACFEAAPAYRKLPALAWSAR